MRPPRDSPHSFPFRTGAAANAAGKVSDGPEHPIKGGVASPASPVRANTTEGVGQNAPSSDGRRLEECDHVSDQSAAARGLSGDAKGGPRAVVPLTRFALQRKRMQHGTLVMQIHICIYCTVLYCINVSLDITWTFSTHTVFPAQTTGGLLSRRADRQVEISAPSIPCATEPSFIISLQCLFGRNGHRAAYCAVRFGTPCGGAANYCTVGSGRIQYWPVLYRTVIRHPRPKRGAPHAGGGGSVPLPLRGIPQLALVHCSISGFPVQRQLGPPSDTCRLPRTVGPAERPANCILVIGFGGRGGIMHEISEASNAHVSQETVVQR